MSIQRKLFLALLTVSFLIVVCMYGFLRWSVNQGMLEYVNQRALAKQDGLVERLQDSYAERGQGDWEFLRGDRRQWFRLIRGDLLDEEHPPLWPRPWRERPGFHRPPPEGASHPPGAPPPRPGEPGRLVLLDEDAQPVVGHYDPGRSYNERLLLVDGREIGRLLVPRNDRLVSEFDIRFVQKLNTVLIIGSLMMVLVAALAAWLLSTHFLKPIRQLAVATTALAGGDYDRELSVQRRDELGQLSRDFNELSRTLKANEQARSRWLADMSHELRTPLSVMRAEVEAAQDGVRLLDTDTLGSLHEELRRLQKLVADLQELSNADIGALRYNKTDMNLADVIAEVAERHRPLLATAGLELSVEVNCTTCRCFADPDRITQLLDNLLDNSGKYTDAGGKVRLGLHEWNGGLRLCVDDSAPTVPEEALPHLFEHLFRAESSRNRDTGGSGLGLAICQRIVEAHGGEIAASHSRLGGLSVTIDLPSEPSAI